MPEQSPASSNTSLQEPSYQRYSQPHAMLAPVLAIINAPPGWHRDNLFRLQRSTEELEAIHRMIQNQHNLVDDAIAYYSRPTQTGSARLIPQIIEPATPKDMISSILNTSPGMLLSVMRDSFWSLKFFIENIEKFKEAQVTTVYMEHLQTDVHQAALSQLPASSPLPVELNTYLEQLATIQTADPHGRYTWLEAVKAAHRQGLRIIPIDCLATYYLRGLPDPHNNLRQLAMNYYAQSVIKSTARGKWVALLGSPHTNRFNLIPGIAELTNAVSIRIDADIDVPHQVSKDVGTYTEDPKPRGEIWSFADLLVSAHHPATLTNEELDARIKRPGQFLVAWCAELNRFVIRYRSRTGQAIAISIKEEGRNIYIENEAPRWRSVHGRRYSSVAALCQDLDIRLGLERVLMSHVRHTDSSTRSLLLEQTTRNNLLERFKQKKNTLLLHMSVFSSQQERNDFSSGKRLMPHELNNLALNQADLLTLIHYFTDPPGSLSFSQQGALLVRIHMLQAQKLVQQTERWAGHMQAKGGSWVKRLSHNLYLASAERSIGVCSAITAQVAAAWLLDRDAVDAPHLGNYLATFTEAIHNSQLNGARLFGLGLLEWSFIPPESKFGQNPILDLPSVEELISVMARADPPAAYQLSRGEHAMMLAVKSNGADRSYTFADPNYGVARFESGEALKNSLAFHYEVLQVLERYTGAEPALPPGFRLRQYRRDLPQQPLFTSASPSRSVTHLGDLCRTENLSSLFGLNSTLSLDVDPTFQKLKNRLTLSEYRMQMAEEEQLHQDSALHRLLLDILRKHDPTLGSGACGFKITFSGQSAFISISNPAGIIKRMPMAIDGTLHPQDVAFLRQYQAFINKLSGRSTGSLLNLFQPRQPMNFDTLYLASALPEDGFALPEPFDFLQQNARQSLAAVIQSTSRGDERRMALSLARQEGERMAETFEHVAMAWLANESEPGRWIPLMHTLKSKADGETSIELADRNKPGKTEQRVSNDPRWLQVQTFLQDKTLHLAHSTRPEPQTETLDGLNSAFAIQAMLRWLYHRNDQQAGSPGVRSNLALAVQIQNRIGLGQIALGTLKDADTLRNLVNSALGAETSVRGYFLSRAGSGLQLVSTLFDVYELSQAESEAQKAVFGTHLAFDSAGLGLGALEFAGLETAPFGEAIALGEITGPLGVVVAGVGVGVSALVENFAALARNVIAVGRHFQTLHDNYQAGGYRYNASASRLEPLPLVVIKSLDFTTSQVEFDSPQLYAAHRHGILGTPCLDSARAHAFDLRARMRLAASARLPADAQAARSVQLPAVARAYIGYGYRLMAGCSTRHDAGFDLLRTMEGDDFTFDCMPVFEYAIGHLDFEYVDTRVSVKLDARDRTLLMPDLALDSANKLTYDMVGKGARYHVVLKPAATLSLSSDDPAHAEWWLDTSEIHGEFSSTRSGNGLEVRVGDTRICFPEIANVGQVKFLDQHHAQHQLNLQDGHLEPMEFDARNWVDQQGQLHNLLVQHKTAERYVVLDGYRIDGQREIARAYYDTQRNTYLYIDDTPPYPEARLLAQLGDELYFSAGEQQHKILRVNAQTRRVEWIYAAQQGRHRLRLQHCPSGLYLEQDNATGGLPLYQIGRDTLTLFAIRHCPELITRLENLENISKPKEYLPPLITLADSSRGLSLGSQVLPCAFAPWIALDAPEGVNESEYKRAYWIRSIDGRILKPNLQPPQGQVTLDRPARHSAWPIPADLVLCACDKLSNGTEVFFFYSAQEQQLYRQEGLGQSVLDPQHPTAMRLPLPGKLLKLARVDGKRSALLEDGRIGVIDAAGQFTLSAINWQFISQRTRWWEDLKAMAGNGTLSVLDLKTANGSQALPAWFHDGRLIVAHPTLPVSVQLLGLSEDAQHAILYDPFSLTSYCQPLQTEETIARAFTPEGHLQPGLAIPSAQALCTGPRLTLIGNTLTATDASNTLPLIKGVNQLLLEPIASLSRLTIAQAVWSHYQLIVIDLAEREQGNNSRASSPALDLEIDNPLALTASREGNELRFFDRSSGKSLRVLHAFASAGRLKTAIGIKFPQGKWLDLGRHPLALAPFSDDDVVRLLTEPCLPDLDTPPTPSDAPTVSN